MIAALALAAAAFSATYDCRLTEPKSLNQVDGKPQLNTISLPGVAEGAWKFHLGVARDKRGLNATVTWPENPIQLAGTFAGLPTADGSIAFVSFSMGPCMFTESACMSLVNLVESPDGTAKVIVTPSALASDDTAKTRTPFLVLIEGTCNRTGNAK